MLINAYTYEVFLQNQSLFPLLETFSKTLVSPLRLTVHPSPPPTLLLLSFPLYSPSMDLESLISQTKALSWENPFSQIETRIPNPANDE
jgi:hypothetical protein